jgi:2-desacetyl-2-hydroxyethyl bacteriochlorophyllide A dehydrogenase
VLVKVKACGICGTDVHAFKTGIASSRILGHEWSGEVAEIGADIQGLKRGERVLGVGYVFKDLSVLVPGEGLDGAFAEYVVVPRPKVGDSFLHIPDNLTWEEAATVEPASIAAFAVEQAQLQSDDIVIVVGVGMIGQFVAQMCKVTGVLKIIAVEPSKMRRDTAKRFGADVVIDPSSGDAVEVVKETTSGMMANVVFECSGKQEGFVQATRMVRHFGRWMQVGLFEQSLELKPEIINQMLTYKNIHFRGCAGQSWGTALELVKTGQVKAKELITHEFLLDDIKDAFETQLDANSAIKVLVKP